MSWKLLGQIEDLVLDKCERAVMMVLCQIADHCQDKDGQWRTGINCYPSVAAVAWRCDYSERQVQRALRRLELAGILVACRTHPVFGTTEYEIHLDRAATKAIFTPKARRQGGGRVDLPRGDKMAPLGAVVASPIGQTRSRAVGRGDSHTTEGENGHRAVTSSHPADRNEPSNTGDTMSPDPKNVPLGTDSMALFHPDDGTNNAELNYREQIQKTFAQLPSASPKPADKQIIRKWFSEKVPAETVEAALWIGAMRHAMGQNHTRTLAISYFLPVVEECLKTSIPPKYVDYIKHQIPDIARDRAKFEEAVIREAEEEIARERRFQEAIS